MRDAVGARDQHAALLQVRERVFGPEYADTLTVCASMPGSVPSRNMIIRKGRGQRAGRIISARIFGQRFTEPWGKKGEFLLGSLNVRHPDRRIVRGGAARFGKIPNYLRFASSSAEDLWGATETRLHEPLEAINRGDCIVDPSHEAVILSTGHHRAALHPEYPRRRPASDDVEGAQGGGLATVARRRRDAPVDSCQRLRLVDERSSAAGPGSG
jgi:hypothetical protein